MEKAEKHRKQEEDSTKERTSIYKGVIVSVVQEKIHLADGTIKIIDKVIHPGAVAIVPIDEKQRILCIRQWRRSTGSILLEIPAGVIEQGESIETCAQRELQEETGFCAKTLFPLGGFYTAPGFCTEYIHLFLAKDLQYSPLWADDTDHIDIIPYSLSELLCMVQDGKVLDSKTLSAICLYQLFLEKEKKL